MTLKEQKSQGERKTLLIKCSFLPGMVTTHLTIILKFIIFELKTATQKYVFCLPSKRDAACPPLIVHPHRLFREANKGKVMGEGALI